MSQTELETVGSDKLNQIVDREEWKGSLFQQKLEEKIQWLNRYLIHLEKGGKRIQAGPDYWAQHENHKLIVEYGEDEQGNIKRDILFLWIFWIL